MNIDFLKEMDQNIQQAKKSHQPHCHSNKTEIPEEMKWKCGDENEGVKALYLPNELRSKPKDKSTSNEIVWLS
jgi:hypothetical protein